MIAVAIFCGAVSIAVYSGSWSALNSGVASATGATAVSVDIDLVTEGTYRCQPSITANM